MNKMMKSLAVDAFAFPAASCRGHYWHHYQAYNAYPVHNDGYDLEAYLSYDAAPSFHTVNTGGLVRGCALRKELASALSPP